MGILGSTEQKEENKQDTNNIQSNLVSQSQNKESATFPIDKRSNNMDINDIIGMPSEAGTESTLESEIDALSKIIDTKDSTNKLEDNDEDFKLDNDDLSFTAAFPCDPEIENDKCDLLQDDGFIMQNILETSGEINKFVSTSVVETTDAQETLDDVLKPTDELQDNDAAKEQREQAEVLHSPKSADKDSVIESLLSTEPVNEEYDLQSESCLESPLVPVPDIHNVIEIENKTEINETENAADSLKSHNVILDENEIESKSNLPTESKEIDDIFKDTLVIDSEITETLLEKETDKQTIKSTSLDQIDFVSTVSEIKKSVDIDILQNEDVNSSQSHDLIKENINKETPIEVDTENEYEEKDFEEQKILVKGISESIAGSVETSNIIDTAVIPENTIIEESAPINPVDEIETVLKDITKTDESVESNTIVSEQTEINLTEGFAISKDNEPSEILPIENQTLDKMDTENPIVHECQITESIDTNIFDSQELEKNTEVKESTHESVGISNSSFVNEELKEELVKVNEEVFEKLKESNDNYKMGLLEEIGTTNAQAGQTQETTNSGMNSESLQKIIESSEKIDDIAVVENVDYSKEIINNETLINENQSIDSNLVCFDHKNIQEGTSEKECIIEELISAEIDHNEECDNINETVKSHEIVNCELLGNSLNQNNATEIPTDYLIRKSDELIILKESEKSIVSTTFEEIEQDQNVIEKLIEAETSETPCLVEDNFESKTEKEDAIEEILHEKIVQDTEKPVISVENEDPVKIDSSIEPDENSSLIYHNETEEQMLLKPQDILLENENIIDEKVSESKAIDPVSSNSLDANKKINEILINEQLLNSQDLSSCALNDVDDMGSDLNELLNAEDKSNKEAVPYVNSETSNFPDRKFQTLNEKSQDSELILNVLESKPLSIDQEKENNIFESTEKGNKMSLIFDESSQSPNNAGSTGSDKFVNDLYKNCVPDDTIDNNDAPVENINECNKPSSVTEQTDRTNMEISKDLNLNVKIEGDVQLEDVKVPEQQLKDLNNEDTNIEESAEISELESAVKFLQESEEQDIENSRIVQNVNNIHEDNPSVFVAVEDSVCDNTSELISDLPETTLDPIAISEAEIISEAAKLENERKEKLQMENLLKSSNQDSSDLDGVDTAESESPVIPSIDKLLITAEPHKSFNILSEISSMDTLKVPVLIQTKLTSGVLPEASLLDDRYKEPPKIEIPEISPPLPSTPRASLLIQKDAKQRMESPDRLSVYSEPKITDTPKKDTDKQQQQQYLDSENIGSPRIILKIAKSAIADCSEPRSPKSPKIRSAANSPNPDDSPGQKLGKIKLKLSKGGHPSIIPNNDEETMQWHTDSPSSASPLGMKIKFSKSGEASVMESTRSVDEAQKVEEGYKPETPIGMKIKLSKSGDASIVQQDNSPKEGIEGKTKHKDAKESAQEVSSTKKQDSPSIGMKIKLSKSGDASIIQQDVEEMQDNGRRTDSPLGMKIKLSKSGDATVVPNEILEETSEKTEEPFKRTDSPMGVRIKLAKDKSGNTSIISSETIEESENAKKNKESESIGDESTKAGIGMKIKLSKSGDASVIREDPGVESSRKSGELPIGMKIKLSKTGDPSIIHTDTSKKCHSDVLLEAANSDTLMTELPNKRKEITVSPIESKKAKMDPSLKQMLPDVTIQPVGSPAKDQQKLMLDPNVSNISRQQMNVINQEISITQICSLSTGDTLMGERLKNALNVQSDPTSSSPLNSDCEIIEPQPELIIVNENSNSSQDIMIIDEVPPPKSLIKVPKKRGRPRRNAVASTTANVGISSFQEQFELQRDPLSLDQPPLPMFQQQLHEQMQLPGAVPATGEGSERPRRTCRSQKSYAPPKRGRGRGRGKRRNDTTDVPFKKQRVEQDLTAIENATTAVIALEKLPIESSPELFRALNQPTLERIIGIPKPTEQSKDIGLGNISKNLQTSAILSHQKKVQVEVHRDLPADVPEDLDISEVPVTVSHLSTPVSTSSNSKKLTEVDGQLIEKTDSITIKVTEDEEKQRNEIVVLSEQADMTTSTTGQHHQNWLAPSIRKVSIESTSARTDSAISTLTVIDEETRMSSESCSRSQTPARNISIPGTSEAVIVNEESQGSTATTESEKVKVKNRRMEISFDPDEGPFTVEKIAEYEWPPRDDEARPAATRAETSMIQEQISQYLGVKSFKRKYPDLKRRMVDMEERNFLRENGLVSESMCDMGLTAVSSSEVLDIMCSDFPEQYEEYRKHMREKAAKEHSKKQKELSAAANAERNRIDLAEMAMQSALNWNLGLNKARRENRRCSLDLQTFTVHMPKRPMKFDSSRRGNHYPVALIPGQYTDYYREYTPAELRYYPLNTVLYGPMRPNERKFDSQSEGSQSDSDSDSSSDDSSSSSSEGTQDTEGSQSTMDEVDLELAIQSDIKCKMCLNHLNKSNRPEVLIQCGTCNGNVHPSCIDLTLDMVPHIRAYAWQCTDCKTCAQCHDPADEDKMLFCDMCDRGYHIYCVGLRRVPQGRWHCQECAVCANCGSKEPGGANSDRNSVAQWQHEYKKADKNTRVYVSTFCVPCSKLWRKGRYCPHCSRCHNAPRLDLEPNLVHCGACDKYLHLGCVETKGLIIDKKNYLCEFCSPSRQHLVKPLISKTFKT